MESSPEPLVQPAIGNNRPANSSAFKQKRSNILHLLAVPAGFACLVARRSRDLTSDPDYRSYPCESPWFRLHLPSFGIKTVNKHCQRRQKHETRTKVAALFRTIHSNTNR